MTKCKLQQPVFVAATELSFKETEQGFFIEAFLISDRLNANNWMVTKEANKADGQDFVGKPDIIFVNEKGKRDHTTGKTLKESLKVQEPFRKGTIKKVKGTDTGRKLTTISKIEDPDTIAKIKSLAIRFVSPAIFPKSLEDVEVVQTGPNSHIHIVHRYNALHRAFVDEPAYGAIDADIGATCEGDGTDCMVKLQQKQAQIDQQNIEPLREIPLVKIKTSKCSETGNLILEMPAGELNDMVSKCLSEKLGPGEEPTDQDIAICFDEAREKLNKSKAKESKLATPNSNKDDIYKSKHRMADEEETERKIKELESKAQEVEKDLKKIQTAQDEMKEKMEEGQDDDEDKKNGKKGQNNDEDKKNGKRGQNNDEKKNNHAKKSQDEMTEEEKKEAQEEEKKKEDEMSARIASELSVKIPLVDTYVAAKKSQKNLDEKATTELRDNMLKASIDEIKDKLDDIGPYIAIQKSQKRSSEIGYGLNDGAFTGASDLDNKTSEELLEELEA